MYPVLAVIEVLKPGVETQQGTSPIRLDPSASKVELLWIGTRDGIDSTVVPRAGVRFEALDVGGLRGARPLDLVRNLVRLLRGIRRAYRTIDRFQPDVILSTGGYVSVPAVLAGRIRQVPIVIYLPDIVPGLAVRMLARLAGSVAVSFEASRQYLPHDKVVVTGYPVRPEVQGVGAAEARDRLGLDPSAKTVLVFGGSRGARRINRAVAQALEPLLELAQLIHISGQLDHDEMQLRRDSLPPRLGERYHLFDYLHEPMIDALAAADLAVSRAGAATLGEFPAAGLPAILVPYPHAGAHQAENAAILAAGDGAVVISDTELTGERLLETVHQLLTDEDRLEQMRTNMRRLARPDAAQQIADLLIRTATE